MTNLHIIHKAHMTWHPLVRHLVLWMIWVLLDEHQKPSYLPTHIYISPPSLPYHLFSPHSTSLLYSIIPNAISFELCGTIPNFKGKKLLQLLLYCWLHQAFLFSPSSPIENAMHFLSLNYKNVGKSL